tara:strand:+ start:2118 stop:2453 length:336 start_codon:yes stop_codon:yes gene_type:complete
MTTKPYTEKQLFDSLISQSVYGVWIALGKIQNPMTNEMSVELTQASIQIDMLDMINNRMHASLTDDEKEYLDKVLSELKMNYVEVEKAEDAKPIEEPAADSEDETKEKSEK